MNALLVMLVSATGSLPAAVLSQEAIEGAPSWTSYAAGTASAGALLMVVRMFVSGAIVARPVADRDRDWAERCRQYERLLAAAQEREDDASRREDAYREIVREALSRGVAPRPPYPSPGPRWAPSNGDMDGPQSQ